MNGDDTKHALILIVLLVTWTAVAANPDTGPRRVSKVYPRYFTDYGF